MPGKQMCTEIGIDIVGFNVPVNTLQVISETISPTNHLAGAKQTGLSNQSLGWY